MRRIRWIGAMLIILSLIVMLLPVTEADAAASASDFVTDKEVLIQYKGTEKNVVIPNTVEVIGAGAFQGNTKVETIVFPNSVKKIEAYAFWGCDSLKTVTLGSGLNEIGDMAFNNCTGLEYMTIPSTVERIGIKSFAYCQRLEDITIPMEVIDIREDSFEGDYLLNIHCDPGSYADKYAQEFYVRQKEMTVYKVPDDDKKPESDQDQENGSDQEIIVPEVVGEELGRTHIVGNQAVMMIQNSNLSVLSGPPAGESADEVQRVVAERAHYRDDSLGTVAVPAEILEIAPFAYARSTVAEITLPDGLKKIDYAAFYHCDDLTEVTLPDSVECVEAKAFAHTPWMDYFMNELVGAQEEPFLISGGVLVAYRGNAEEIVIPEGVRVIAAEAFMGHEELRKVTFPESLKVVGDRAFEDCSLESLDYSEDVPDRLIMEMQVTLAEQSAAPAQTTVPVKTVSQKWIPAVLLFLLGSSCIVLGARRKALA